MHRHGMWNSDKPQSLLIGIQRKSYSWPWQKETRHIGRTVLEHKWQKKKNLWGTWNSNLLGVIPFVAMADTDVEC